MDANEPGLFDLPARERPGTPIGRCAGGTGRRGPAPLAPRSPSSTRGHSTKPRRKPRSNAVTIGLHADPDVEDTEPGASDVAPASNAFDALGWLLWPTDGMEGPLEAGAFRILSVDSEVVAESVDRGTVTWTVTVKLTDVDELRRLAAEAHPDAAGLIADSLAVAWQRAADPFAPLRSIPGTAWRPGRVDVEHLPAGAVGDR